MSIKELAEYCSSINNNCDICHCRGTCGIFTERIEDIAPSALIDLVESGEDLK